MQVFAVHPGPLQQSLVLWANDVHSDSSVHVGSKRTEAICCEPQENSRLRICGFVDMYADITTLTAWSKKVYTYLVADL